MRPALIAAAAVLCLAAAATSWSAPTIDEYCFAGLEALDAANLMFVNWSGRWIGMFTFAAINPKEWQPLITLLGLPIWFVGFYLAAACATERPLQPAIIALAVFWAGCPSVGEAFQYLAGIIMYGVPFSLLAGAAFLLVRRSYWAIVPAIVATFFNEIAAVALLAGLIPFLRSRPAQVTMAATFAAFMIVVLSPGNAERASTLEEVSPLALAYYVVRPYDSPWPLFFDFRLWAMAALFAFTPGGRNIRPMRVGAGLVLAIAGSVTAVTFGGHMAPQGRVLDFTFALTVVGAAVIALATPRAGNRTIAAWVLALGLVTGPNVGNIARGWGGTPEAELRTTLRAKEWQCGEYFGN